MSKTILFVEDDIVLLEIMERFLKEAGFGVKIAKDGIEALESVKASSPDLMLLDILLPRLDGFSVMMKMKEDPKLAKIPVVILSNFGSKEDIKKGLDLGAVEYLIKASFTPEEVIAKIHSIFERK